MSWFSRRPGPCDRVRDRLLEVPNGEAPLPAELSAHLAGCADCRELAEALAAVAPLGPAWMSVEPPPGLAQRTVEFLEPHWKPAERPVSREEIRMIWTGALGMAGATAAILLIVLDARSTLGQAFAAEGIVRIGVRLTIFQFVAGTILSLVLLAIRAARSSEAEPKPRPDRNRGGSE